MISPYPLSRTECFVRSNRAPQYERSRGCTQNLSIHSIQCPSVSEKKSFFITRTSTRVCMLIFEEEISFSPLPILQWQISKISLKLQFQLKLMYGKGGGSSEH